MNVRHAALLALYLPVALYSAWALVLYTKSTIWPAAAQKRLNMRKHGLPLAIALLLLADLAENIFYGIGRINEDLFMRIKLMSPVVVMMKLLILSGATFAISSWYEVVYGRRTFMALWFGAGGLYVGALFALLMLT